MNNGYLYNLDEITQNFTVYLNLLQRFLKNLEKEHINTKNICKEGPKINFSQ